MKRRTNLAKHNASRRDGYVSKRAIWAYVSENSGCTTRQVAEAVGLGKTAVLYHVDGLLATGVLVAGSSPGGVRSARSLRAPVPLIEVR